MTSRKRSNPGKAAKKRTATKDRSRGDHAATPSAQSPRRPAQRPARLLAEGKERRLTRSSDDALRRQVKEDDLEAFRQRFGEGRLTTDHGIPIPQTDDSLKAGLRGPSLL